MLSFHHTVTECNIAEELEFAPIMATRKEIIKQLRATGADASPE
jgi:hypothetical protein